MDTLLRYLTKQKFVWLLEDMGVYVSPANIQDDSYEGIYDHTMVFEPLRDVISEFGIEQDRMNQMAQGLMEINRDVSHLSCWYMGDTESWTMWKDYGSGGVLLLTSSLRLIRHLPEPLGIATDFGEVDYDDEKKKLYTDEPLLVKNQCWNHQNEFRLIFNAHEYSLSTGYEKDKFSIAFSGGRPSYEDPAFAKGYSAESMSRKFDVITPKGSGHILKYDLSALIQEIRMHPLATAEDLISVKESLSSAGLDIPVVRSRLTGSTPPPDFFDEDHSENVE